MPVKKDVHLKALVDAVESGVPRREIMERFKFNSPTQVTAYYLDGLVEIGRAQAIVGRRLKTVRKGNTVKVARRGSISIPKEMIQEMGYQAGDSFRISKTRAGVILKPLKE